MMATFKVGDRVNFVVGYGTDNKPILSAGTIVAIRPSNHPTAGGAMVAEVSPTPGASRVCYLHDLARHNP
jgi:hypothetical protein